MKTTMLPISLLAASLVVSGTTLADPLNVPDGWYKGYFDNSGNEVTDFVPWDELGNATFTPVISVTPSTSIKQRSALTKRREDCHPDRSVPEAQTDAANKCLLDSFADDPIKTTANGYVRWSVSLFRVLHPDCDMNSYTDCDALISVCKW